MGARQGVRARPGPRSAPFLYRVGPEKNRPFFSVRATGSRRSRNTPYAGWRVKGRGEVALVGGVVKYEPAAEAGKA